MRARDVRLLAAAALGSSVILVGWIGFRAYLPGVHVCPTVARTGKPCATCGGTRAWRSAMRGEFSRAFEIHPPAAFVGMATWGFMITATFAVVSGRARYAVAGLAITASLLLAALAYQAWIAGVVLLAGNGMLTDGS